MCMYFLYAIRKARIESNAFWGESNLFFFRSLLANNKADLIAYLRNIFSKSLFNIFKRYG